MNPPPGIPRWGAALPRFLCEIFHAALPQSLRKRKICRIPTRPSISIRTCADQRYGLPAPRLTYNWRRPNELARIEYMVQKMEELGRAMGAAHVWRGPIGGGAPGAHHMGGMRMGSDPKTSVVNKYGAVHLG